MSIFVQRIKTGDYTESATKYIQGKNAYRVPISPNTLRASSHASVDTAAKIDGGRQRGATAGTEGGKVVVRARGRRPQWCGWSGTGGEGAVLEVSVGGHGGYLDVDIEHRRIKLNMSSTNLA